MEFLPFHLSPIPLLKKHQISFIKSFPSLSSTLILSLYPNFFFLWNRRNGIANRKDRVTNGKLPPQITHIILIRIDPIAKDVKKNIDPNTNLNNQLIFVVLIECLITIKTVMARKDRVFTQKKKRKDRVTLLKTLDTKLYLRWCQSCLPRPRHHSLVST